MIYFSRPFFCLVILLILWCKPANAISTKHGIAGQSSALLQDATVPLRTTAIDSTEVVVRTPPPGILEAYLENPDYNYATGKNDVLGWWDQLKTWLFERLSNVFDDNGQSDIWEFVFYAIALAIFGYALLGFLKMDVGSLFSAKKRSTRGVFTETQEDLREKNFLSLAEGALQQNDLRLTIRMYYMHVLKILDEREVILWSPRKTNQDYLRECRLREIMPAFARLIYLFDHSWYGDFPVDLPLVEEARMLTLSLIEEPERVS